MSTQAVEQVFFNVPLSKLEPIFKRWIREVQNEFTQTIEQPTTGSNPSEYIPKNEVLELLGITSVTLWRWEKQEKITSYGIGGKRYFKRSDIEQLFTEIKKA